MSATELGWVTAGLLLALAVFTAFCLDRSEREVRRLRHLCNGYRAELGEPPLFPSEAECDICNPSPAASQVSGS